MHKGALARAMIPMSRHSSVKTYLGAWLGETVGSGPSSCPVRAQHGSLMDGPKSTGVWASAAAGFSSHAWCGVSGIFISEESQRLILVSIKISKLRIKNIKKFSQVSTGSDVFLQPLC